MIEQKNIAEWVNLAPKITKLIGKERYMLDYDTEADVLYLSFQRPQKATDSKMLDNGVLLRFRNKQLVGMTILDASKRDQRS